MKVVVSDASGEIFSYTDADSGITMVPVTGDTKPAVLGILDAAARALNADGAPSESPTPAAEPASPAPDAPTEQ